MKVELHSNGSTQVAMTAEKPLEDAFLRTMLEAAQKGATVRLVSGWDGNSDPEGMAKVVVSVEG